MSVPPPPDPAPAPQRHLGQGAQVLGSLLVALVLVLGAAVAAAAALHSNPTCQHPVEVAQGGELR